MSLVKRGGWNRDLHPGIESKYPDAYISMGLTAENLAKDYSIYGLSKKSLYYTATIRLLVLKVTVYLLKRLLEIKTNENVIDVDGCMRETSVEKMARLPPAFLEDGTVTAATSSPLTDGAACNLICSDKYAEEHSIGGLAEIVSTAVVGVPPHIMGIGPAESSKKALNRAGITMDEVDVIELNEAFSAQSIAVLRDLDLTPEDSRLNIDGGALAIGHPLGASGARILGKAASLLNRVDGEYALVRCALVAWVLHCFAQIRMITFIICRMCN